jgi:endonuclease/exonuclease/phosphatase family metal-dependent hydrolase
VGEFRSDEYRIIYSGAKRGQRGVALLLDKEVSERVSYICQHSDRILVVRIAAEPVDVVLIQVYMPTTDADDEEVESMYEQIEGFVRKEKGTDQVIIMGDWNAVVGEERDGKVVGDFALGRRNERGQQLIDFCKRMGMVATNTWFSHEKRRRYTWKKPGDTERFQIDYILVKQRYRNSVTNSRAYPGADANSDHNLVVANIRLKLKKIQRGRRKKRWCMENLESKKIKFQLAVRKNLEKDQHQKDENANHTWIRLREAIAGGAKEAVGYQNARTAKKPWVTDKMLQKMDKRRNWKGASTEEGKKTYRRLNNELRRETDKARDEWWEAKCKELEEYDRRGRSDLLYQEVGKITRTENKTKATDVAINDRKVQMINEMSEVLKRWKEYIEDLYRKDTKPIVEDFEMEEENIVDNDQEGPGLIREEVLAVIKDMKNGKSIGIEEIPAQLLKMLDTEEVEMLVELC